MEKKKPLVNITYFCGRFTISREFVREIFSFVLRHEKKPANCVIDVAFTGNTRIKKLNSIYRGKNKPTDILTFVMDNDFVGAIHELPLLGEIIISVPYAAKQAKNAETRHAASLREEIIFLLIHGLLHLLGYDDETQSGYDAMMKKQNKYFNALTKRKPSGAKRNNCL